MNLNSKIHQNIYSKVILPSLNRMQGTVEGYVLQTNYTKLVCDVVYTDENNHSMQIMKNVALPKDGDGVFTQSVLNGDRVTISFKNKSKESPYISTVYKNNQNENNFQSPYGGRTIRQSRIF